MSATILIVDDHLDTVEYFRKVLESEGYHTRSALNGREALQSLLGPDPAPDLVLLDLAMPVMDGGELLKVMRSYTRLARVPVALVTANEVSAEAAPAFDAILEKPVEREHLIAAVRKILLKRDSSSPSP